MSDFPFLFFFIFFFRPELKMGFSLGDLILSATLIANAVAILNDERFLKKCLLFFSFSFQSVSQLLSLFFSDAVVVEQTAGATFQAMSLTAP